MKKSNGTYNSKNHETDDNWRALATAIVNKAIEDYKVALKKNNKNGIDGIDSLERFFHTDWFDVLFYISTYCYLDSKNNDIPAKLRLIFERQEINKNTKRKRRA